MARYATAQLQQSFSFKEKLLHRMEMANSSFFMLFYLYICYILIHILCVQAWSSEDFALYDLVEEIPGDFYSFFGIKKDATLSEIKKSYRRLSMEWHPDRNSSPEAPDKFRKVAAVYEVLKSAQLREKYNFVLENGLPNWRQPVYYIRRAKKLSWYETVAVLLAICTAGHYLMLWGAYVDEYLTLSSNKGKLRQKAIRQLKKTRGAVDAEELQEARIADQLTKIRPSLKRLLPIILVTSAIKFIKDLPTLLVEIYKELKNSKNASMEDDSPKQAFHFNPTVIQPVYEYEIASDIQPISSLAVQSTDDKVKSDETHPAVKQKRKWTSEEIKQLITLTTEKYPVGSINRWEKISKVLNRLPGDVTAMAAQLKNINKEEFTKVLMNQNSSINMNIAKITNADEESVKEVELDSNDSASTCCKAATEIWTQNDQRLLEVALQKYPKGTAERWDKIVSCVPNKTKQQCLDRFKYLSEMVRQRKLQKKINN
uniref:DnaJ homolog subfamily C member 1 n=1 Tax=Syphacia muris TaxID=451379 RepID=A0A158R613_9BILA